MEKDVSNIPYKCEVGEGQPDPRVVTGGPAQRCLPSTVSPPEPWQTGAWALRDTAG